MKKFLFTMASSILPSLLRLLAAAFEGYLEGLHGIDGGEKNESKSSPEEG